MKQEEDGRVSVSVPRPEDSSTGALFYDVKPMNVFVLHDTFVDSQPQFCP